MASSPAPTSKPPARSLWDRLIPLFAALVCLFFVSTLLDTALVLLAAPRWIAPPVPASIRDRDASARVYVSDEAGNPLPFASVRVFSIRGDKTYFAGERRSDAGGVAAFDDLPQGETWILAYDKARARTSTRLILQRGPHEARLVLLPAKALDVLVVNEAGEPVEKATVRLRSGDPLPHIAVTDAEGKARLDRLGPAPYQVRATALGYDESVRTGVVPSLAPLRIKLERRGVLTVTVRRLDGSVAEDATVLIAGPELWPARSTQTDAAGKAVITALRSGVYDIKARLGEFVSETQFAVPVKNGEHKEAELTLLAGRMVRITITDGDTPDAKPIPNASVLLVEEGIAPFPLQGRTDEAGLVVLGPITMSMATVSARAPGFVGRSAVVLDDFATEIRLGLTRGGALIGDVVDDRGFPVSGATIEVVGVDTEGMPIDETSALVEFREDNFEMLLGGPAPLIPMGELGVMPGPIPELPRDSAPSLGTLGGGGEAWVTRVDGTFRAEPLSPGRVHAIVRHPDYVEALSETVNIVPGGEASVHVVLRRGGLLEGRVLEEDRTPVAGARVELSATQGTLERVTYAADDGTFTFAAVPDEVLLSVARPDAPADIVARLIVSVPDTERREVEILLPKQRGAVVIRVNDDRGYPLDRVEIHALSLDVDVPIRRTLFTNDDGVSELRDAEGVPFRIMLSRPGKAPRIEQVERASKELVFTMSAGLRAKGSVTARDGRDRLEDADVTLYLATGIRRAKTNLEGDFEFEDVPPGPARLSASHKDHAPNEIAVKIEGDADHPADLGAIDLSEAGDVEGEVLDADEKPLAGVRVGKDSPPAYLPLGPLPRGIATTDKEGRFTLTGLPEGQVVLGAYSQEFGRGFSEAIPVRAGRVTRGVKILIAGDLPPAKEARGAGSLAVTLGERAEQGKKAVVIVFVPSGGEAELAGIFPGDVLRTVNGLSLRSIEHARALLSGPLNEDLVLGLARDGGAPGQSDPSITAWLTRVKRERVRR